MLRSTFLVRRMNTLNLTGSRSIVDIPSRQAHVDVAQGTATAVSQVDTQWLTKWARVVTTCKHSLVLLVTSSFSFDSQILRQVALPLDDRSVATNGLVVS